MAQKTNLKHTYNQEWDKIKIRKVGGEFTTARAYSPSKDKYYTNGLEKLWNEELKLPNGDSNFLGRGQLIGLDYQWSNDLPLSFIQKDTYAHWTEEDFDNFLRNIYGWSPVYLILNHLVWTEVH